MSAFMIVSAIQGLAILFDEFFFHRKRGLPKWERVGHPIDTMSVVLCLLFLVFIERTATTEIIYYVMGAASCVLVTKDEWVHRKHCKAEEMWLHAVLFMMHPLVLFTAMAEWGKNPQILLLVSAGIFAFFVYQVVYWNFAEPKLRRDRLAAQQKKMNQDELYEYFGE